MRQVGGKSNKHRQCERDEYRINKFMTSREVIFPLYETDPECTTVLLLWEPQRDFSVDDGKLNNNCYKGTKSCWRRHMKEFLSKMTFWTAYLWLAAPCFLVFPPAAVILTDYFITLKSLLFPQSSPEASGSPHTPLFNAFSSRK